MTNLNIKRGDTFYYSATWTGATVAELKSQVRDSAGKLVADVVIEATGTAGTFKLSVADTTKWAITTLYTDIQRTSGGIVTSSETMRIAVTKDVTQ